MPEEYAQTPAHSLITLSTNGFAITGTWAKRTGGSRSAEERRYREGGELDREEAAPTPATTETHTYSRPYKRSRDIELFRWAHRMAGRAIMAISEQPLDEDGHPFGRPLVETGRLQGVGRPDVDADATGETAYIELVVAPFGDLA